MASPTVFPSPTAVRSDTPLTAELLRPLLARLARRHHVPAAQLAVRSGGRTAAVDVGGVGRDAKFPVGSITKVGTATLAMLLADDDDLDLDDPLGEHLGDLGPRLGALTARQVLSHTGGLPAGSDASGSVRKYVTACRDDEFVTAPGRGFSYSNAGYVLIGQVVEQITGMHWWEAVAALVLRPLGIEPAFVVGPPGSPTTTAFVPGHAVHAVTGRARPVAQTLRPAEAAAGALALSALDLVALGSTHVSRTPLLDAALLREMRHPVPGAEPFGLADGWGLGLARFHGPDADWVGHDGTADGTSCHLRIDPAHGVVVALTTNAATGSALWVDLVAELRALGLPVGDYELPVIPRQPRPVPAGLSGRYANGDMEYVVDVGPDGKAELSVGGEPHPELAIHRGGAFSVLEPATGDRIIAGRFLIDPAADEVTGIQAGGRVARRRPEA